MTRLVRPDRICLEVLTSQVLLGGANPYSARPESENFAQPLRPESSDDGRSTQYVTHGIWKKNRWPEGDESAVQANRGQSFAVLHHEP